MSLTLGVNLLHHEANHSPPQSPNFKSNGAILPLPHYTFKVWCLVTNRNNFMF